MSDVPLQNISLDSLGSIKNEEEIKIDNRDEQSSVYGQQTVNTASFVNKLKLSYDNSEENLQKKFVQDLVHHVLWIEGGDYQGSSTECSIGELDQYSTGSSRNIGQRITYWQNYLKENDRITDKLSKATGKDRCELLMNKSEEYRKIQQCKRVMDVAERLSPTRLMNRHPITSKRIPCVPDIFETLPLVERRGRSRIVFTEMPKVSLEEQRIDGCKVPKSSWLCSEYLGERLLLAREKLKRVMKHYPDSELMQIVGKHVEPDSPKTKSEFPETVDDVEIAINKVFYKEKEPSCEYVISINDEEFDAEELRRENVNFWFTYEGKPFEQVIRTLKIRNRGWKAVDIKFVRSTKKVPRCLPACGKSSPAFYFKKDRLRLQPGNMDEIEFIFCCRDSGIYEEGWELKLTPRFVIDKKKIMVGLFGHCSVSKQDRKEFGQIDQTLANAASKTVVQDILNEITMYARPDPPKPKPYSTYFSQAELFGIANPSLYYNEDDVEALKDIYAELVQDDYKACKSWNFDMKLLRNLIIDVADETQRKEYYVKYTDALAKMKLSPAVFGPNYEDQKLLLVKNVLLGMADKIDKKIDQLNGAIYQTQYDLDFDEVLVRESFMKIDGSSDQGGKTCVVKSAHIQQMKDQLLQDSLYVQVYGELCSAIDEIVSVVEGINCL